MVFASEPGLLVLHALRLKGFAEDDVVVGVTGLEPDVVAGCLAEAASRELVVRREGRVAGWTLTPAGRETHRRVVEAELAETGARADVDRAYRGFVALNPELLDVCTAWQVREGLGGEAVFNDHTDAAHDAAVVARLAAIHTAIVPVCDTLTGVLDRFGRYRPRLEQAYRRVRAGEPEWLTRPLIDSYHTVWFELHEDLLVTLGLERKEGKN